MSPSVFHVALRPVALSTSLHIHSSFVSFFLLYISFCRVWSVSSVTIIGNGKVERVGGKDKKDNLRGFMYNNELVLVLQLFIFRKEKDGLKTKVIKRCNLPSCQPCLDGHGTFLIHSQVTSRCVCREVTVVAVRLYLCHCVECNHMKGKLLL